MPAELQTQIFTDLKGALKAGDAQLVSVLRLLQSQIKNEELAQRVQSLPTEDIQRVIQREVKKRREASTAFRSAGREDAATREDTERVLLEAYLPPELSDTEIVAVIQRVQSEMSALGGEVSTGKMIGAVMAQVRGKADGARVKRLVEEALSSP